MIAPARAHDNRPVPPGAALAAVLFAEAPGLAVERAALEAWLDATLTRCREAWPELAPPGEAFVRHLGSRLLAGDDLAALERLHAPDLHLAFACARGEPAALAAFERTHLGQVADFVRHLDRSRDFLDEVTQGLREKLFVAPARKILEYGGKGALGGWLRVVAVRAALDLKRRDPRGAHEPADDELAVPGLDPELDYIKATYRDELAAALRATLDALPPDERAVLRLFYCDGCNIDQIGALYEVHRATVARWLDRSRRSILAETRRLLGQRLRVAPGELDSLIDLMQSRLELSLQRLLPPGGPG